MDSKTLRHEAPGSLSPRSPHRWRRLPSVCLGAAAIAAAAASCSNTKPQVNEEPPTERVETARQGVAGNIHPAAIEIDGGNAGADLYDGLPTNTADASVDWVDDETADNSGENCLGDDAIATCIEAGITGVAGGTGTWNGIRIVDGIGDDDDVFLTGGKENEFLTWNPGLGNVGGPKFDLTQAYLANNQTDLFFGMERRGTNGTTAFDFEFNQLAPKALLSCPQDDLVPCRSVGDVLFTFEMKGTNSAAHTFFIWDGNSYEVPDPVPAGIIESLNNVDTPAAPWGYVDQQGNWTAGDLPKFAFGEAKAPISLLPGVDECGGKAFVQVRTRSSSTENSDLKDLTKVFEFQFNSISTTASLVGSCDGSVTYEATPLDTEGEPLAGAVCEWTFYDDEDNELTTATGCAETTLEGFSPGKVYAKVEVHQEDDESCTASATTDEVDVLAGLTIELALDAEPDACPDLTTDAVTFVATPGGGTGTYGLEWNLAGCTDDETDCVVDGDGALCADATIFVTVTDPSGVCPDVTSPSLDYKKVTTISVVPTPVDP